MTITLGAPILLSGNQTAALLPVGMEQSSADPYLECLLQDLIDRQPNILPVCDFLPGVTNIFSLGREIPVNIGDSDGFIDNLLVTNDGHLIIVETKLWRNPDAIRGVLTQTLQYGMAVNQLTSLELEQRLRKSDPKGRRLGPDETIFQFIQNHDETDASPELTDDFEESFDRFRRSGEVLLLIVSDRIRPGVERLVYWMNTTVGSAPYQLGLINLRMYSLPDGGRVVVPSTLFRTREASRHVVTVNLQGAASTQVKVTVSGTDGPTTKPVSPAVLMTEERLTGLIREGNSAAVAAVAEELRARLRSSGLATRFAPTEVQYGVSVAGDFIPLVHLSRQQLWFAIPRRAVRDLGDVRFVESKRQINGIAPFYRPSEIDDPTKMGTLLPRYNVVADKTQLFVDTIVEIAQTVRTAIEETS